MKAAKTGGFTLLEIMIAMAVLAIAMAGLIAVILHTSQMRAMAQEQNTAMRAAQDMVEKMRDTQFENIYAAYNSDPADDPGGAGSAPGSGFQVDGLEVRTGDEDNLAGKIEFPDNDNPPFLQEDLDEPEYDMPMDLNADGVIDSNSRAGDYVILPVRVVIEWDGIKGESTLEYRTILMNR